MKISRKRRIRCAAAVGVAAVLLLLTACGDGSSVSSVTESSAASSAVKDNSSTVSIEAVGETELMTKAISLSGYFSSGLSGLTAQTLGSGPFADYSRLHSNPLESAEYVLMAEPQAAAIKGAGKGIGEFFGFAAENYGFKVDTSKATFTSHNELNDALSALFTAAGDTSGLAAAKSAAAGVSSAAAPVLAEYLSAAAYALKLNREAVAKLDADDFNACRSFSYCTPATSDTATLNKVWQVSKQVSEEKMLLSGAVLTRAAAKLSGKLSAGKALTADGKKLTIDTPAGDIILGTTGVDSYSSPDGFLLIDPAGNDTYSGHIASGASIKKTISVVIDLSGNDKYTAAQAVGATQGSGILGTGLLFDLNGNDTYTAGRSAQGFALIGNGVLYDAAGNDTYSCKVSGQGAGWFGLAIAADAAGNDSYYAYGHAQASAGNRCAAFLVNIGGDDTYLVEPFVMSGYEALEYGQFPGANGNWSQGCGTGQRAINNQKGISGGIAGMIDIGGNDSYTGGIWVQGTGYWSGIGFLFDEEGNDEYVSHYYSQSSVAHYGVGLLVDIGGDDKHKISQQSGEAYAGEGASLAFTWDRGVTMFIDDGGNDIYTASQICGGCACSYYDTKGFAAQDLTYAIFIDTGGSDFYSAASQDSWGFGRGGYLIDADGDDVYLGSRRNNKMSSDPSTQKGGVSIDYTVTEETREAGYVGFWREAKEKYVTGK